MTPKEKAKGLAEKMCSKASPDEGMGWYEAISCALVAVDEMLEHVEMMDDYAAIKYWKGVKQELEKLELL